ncbi:MAG TPA: ferritin family protein [Spirochaetota bacterium]|nr:ferritin family protein [Spirochaetota bacterium]
MYSTKELIDIAMGIEETGFYFYSTFKSKFKDESFQQMFQFLADEELRHKDIFSNMLKGLNDTQGVYTQEYYSYLKAIGTTRVFSNSNDVDTIAQTLNQPLDIIKIAMDSERDSIVWYSELKEIYRNDTKSKDILERLINEERKHVLILLDLKEKLSM